MNCGSGGAVALVQARVSASELGSRAQRLPSWQPGVLAGRLSPLRPPDPTLCQRDRAHPPTSAVKRHCNHGNWDPSPALPGPPDDLQSKEGCLSLYRLRLSCLLFFRPYFLHLDFFYCLYFLQTLVQSSVVVLVFAFSSHVPTHFLLLPRESLIKILSEK